MENNKYKILKNIPIDQSRLFKTHISDAIYKYCVINKLDNLGDFINHYQENKYSMNKSHNFYYFDGIIDLINLIYFGDGISNPKNLVKRIKIFKYKNPSFSCANIKDDYYGNSLRSLGFDKKETKSILNFVLCYKKEVSVITAIKLCIDCLREKEKNEEQVRFFYKLIVLNDYYENNKKEIEELDSCTFDNAKKDLEELKSLYKKILLLKKEIVNKSKEFEEKVNLLPEEVDCVKKLVKEFEKINCKEY